VAKELISKYSYTQVAAAKKLGTTQAAVSQYVTSKRGHRRISNCEKITPLIRNAAAEAAKRIATAGMSLEEFNASFCDLCALCAETKKSKQQAQRRATY
jgi:predicted transcriptional regulator